MEIKGRIIKILPVISGTTRAGNAWRRQDFVLEKFGKEFPEFICFCMWGVRIADLFIGQHVNAFIDVESREYNGRWYTEVRAWKVETLASSPKFVSETSLQPAKSVDEMGNNLPF